MRFKIQVATLVGYMLWALVLAVKIVGAQESYAVPISATNVIKASVMVDFHRLVTVCDALGQRDATTPGSAFKTIAITSSTASNDRILATAHGLVTGQTIIISGHSGSTPAINGARTVTVIDANNFTIGLDITVSGTGGTFTIDCTQANVCLAKGAAGGAACSPAQARAVDTSAYSGRIYTQDLAGRQEWFIFELVSSGLPDMNVKAAAAVATLRARYLGSATQGTKDTDCQTNLGTVATCQ